MPRPVWCDQEETKPAPGDLLLVQAFVNTLEIEVGRDVFVDTESARAWLNLADLLPRGHQVSSRDLTLLRGLREGLRAMLLENGGAEAPTLAELGPLRRLASGSSPELTVERDGQIAINARPGPALSDSLTGLLLIVRDAQTADTWSRLKACSNPECRRAFYDSSRNHRGTWCEMATCGNRSKNRTFRKRAHR